MIGRLPSVEGSAKVPGSVDLLDVGQSFKAGQLSEPSHLTPEQVTQTKQNESVQRNCPN